MSVLGNRVVRVEDPGLLTGATPFVSDITDPLLDGALHVTYVRSAMAHARIAGVDTAEALRQPGVVGIFTAADLGLTPQPSPYSPHVHDRARSRSTSCATSASRSPRWSPNAADQGEDAAELVVVDYDPLPVVVDPMAALAGRDPVVPRRRAPTCVATPRTWAVPPERRRPVRRMRGRGHAAGS